jgi:hypothetical protein
MHKCTPICTKHSLLACLLMHMHSNLIVCIMHSSVFMFQFTYLFIYVVFCCPWISFRYFLPCVLWLCSYALLLFSLNTFQPVSTWPFYNTTNIFYFHQLLLGSPIQHCLYEAFHDIGMMYLMNFHHSNTTTSLNQPTHNYSASLLLLLVVHWIFNFGKQCYWPHLASPYEAIIFPLNTIPNSSLLSFNGNFQAK